MKKQSSLILGTIGEDPHIIGSKILGRVLEGEGYKIIHIGAKCQPKKFIEAAIETKADAILISSLSGHAKNYCQGFRELCNEAGLGNIVIYVGGNIIVSEREWQDVEKEFMEMGLNRVYPPGTRPPIVIEDLKKDLAIKS